MTEAAGAVQADRVGGSVWAWLGGAVKFIVLSLLCLTPVTAVVVLGWLTHKTARDIFSIEQSGRAAGWPNLLRAGSRPAGFNPLRILASTVRGLAFYGWLGIKAWAAVLILLAPFELIWLAGWSAGWENSFNKSYELSGAWPGVSVLAVLLSLPVLTVVPMAIAHQAVRGRISAVFEIGAILRLIRGALWRYLGLTALIAIGWLGVFAVRGLPVFAESFSLRVASGDPELIAAFAGQFKLMTTGLLFAGLLIMRSAMARVYARASSNVAGGRAGGWLKTGAVSAALAAIWLALVFFVYFAQFLNYSWWSWINQPILMLPWLGMLA